MNQDRWFPFHECLNYPLFKINSFKEYADNFYQKSTLLATGIRRNLSDRLNFNNQLRFKETNVKWSRRCYAWSLQIHGLQNAFPPEFKKQVNIMNITAATREISWKISLWKFRGRKSVPCGLLLSGQNNKTDKKLCKWREAGPPAAGGAIIARKFTYSYQRVEFAS